MTVASMDCDIEFYCEQMAEMYANVRVSIELITRDVAVEMLRMNDEAQNRKLNKQHAQHMRDILVAGDMVMNGEPIIFATDGTLLNGQHRLTACVMCNRSFHSLVVRGIDKEAFKTLDSGRTRRSSEVLEMTGEANARNLAAAVQALVNFVESGFVVAGSGASKRKATPALCERVLDAHPGIRDSVRAMKANTLYRTQHSNMLHYLFSLSDRRLSGDFADVLARSSPDINRPFFRFRESLITSPLTTETRRQCAAKAIKAFNAEKIGLRPKMFKFGDKEQFPEIVGLDYGMLADSLKR